jgi:tetratricopeptide (TPR) repeat protein
MKSITLFVMAVIFALTALGQELPKDVEKVYDNAEKLKRQEKYDMAIAEYKEVLRSVSHLPSMIAIADIQMVLRANPNYREAYEYYDLAIQNIDAGIAAASKERDKKYLKEMRTDLVPKRNKAKSYVDQFDGAKENKMKGSRLLEEGNED